MSIPIEGVISWASKNFGIHIQRHQYDRMTCDIEKYLATKNISYNALLTQLQMKAPPFYEDMINIITVQESYFFRDQILFLYLKDTVLPDLIEKKRASHDLSIKVWSAATCYGEELYTIAILLTELLPDIGNWTLDLVGTDINPFVLNLAKEGVYRTSALRSTSKEAKEKYFKAVDNVYHLNTAITSLATFKTHNLKSDIPPNNNYFDIILCRNVLIYFDKATIENALSLFYEALSDNGKLFLGPSDLITYAGHKLKPCDEKGVFFYSKAVSKIEDDIEKNYNTSKQESYVDKQRHRMEGYELIKQSIKAKNYEEALSKVNEMLNHKPNKPLLLRYRAEALIGLGDNMTALDTLECLSQLDRDDPKTYYFMGLCHIEQHNHSKAKNCLKKALQLKNTFPEANHALALLLLNDKQGKEGIAKLILAKEQALESDSTTKMLSSNETMASFAHSIEKEIEYYKGLIDEN